MAYRKSSWTRISLALVFVFAIAFWPRSMHAQSFDHAGLAAVVLERHIRPGYARLAETAGALEVRANSFCTEGTGADIAPVRNAYRDLALAWSRVEHLRFGPAMDEHRHARMLYWPDRKGLGRRQVARALRKRDVSVLTPESLAGKSVAMQGLGAIEILLYGKDATVFSKPGALREHRCGYLRAAAANLSAIARAIVGEWAGNDGYARTFLNPGPDNPVYLDKTEVTLEIAKAFFTGLEHLRDVKIAGPLGLRPNSARHTRAAFKTSRLSTQAIAADLEGLISLYRDGGLRARIEAHEAGMGDAILNDLAQALDSLQAIALPMVEAAQDNDAEDRLMAVGFPLKNAREQTARVLSDAADLSLGFNALDGD